jgi:SEC-C motif-containing protein
MNSCPCNPKKLFADCCEPFLQHKKIPRSPVELMQSRYAAYVVKQEEYLLETWHQTTRPQAVNMDQSPKWLNLQIINTSHQGNQGMVEFKATYMADKTIHILHETSYFVKENDCWFYVNGDLHQPPQGKVGRNDPCPCGSGRKFKKCCG